jgi:4-oxalocrotonate tautomerase
VSNVERSRSVYPARLCIATPLGEDFMPTIRIELFEGRTDEQKRACAKAMTEVVVQTLGGSTDGVDIVFFDIKKQDWASGGVLWSDRLPPAQA